MLKLDLCHIIHFLPFYDPTTNKITIPFGAMQPPLFWTNTKSLTFGGIGFVIGMRKHE